MQVLVTGNQGRIGRYAQAQLEEAGHTVVGFDRATGDDIRNLAALRAAAQGCEAIIHMAAMLADPQDDPNDVMHVNLQGLWHVLTTAEALNIRRVVAFSIVNAVGIFIGESLPDYLPINEDHPCRPGRPYVLSKFLGEGDVPPLYPARRHHNHLPAPAVGLFPRQLRPHPPTLGGKVVTHLGVRRVL